MTKKKKRVSTIIAKKAPTRTAKTRGVKKKPATKRRPTVKKPESMDDRVRRIALDAARSVADNDALTLEDEMDSSMAISIGRELGRAFDVEILGESAQEMEGGRIEEWVDYMRLVRGEE